VIDIFFGSDTDTLYRLAISVVGQAFLGVAALEGPGVFKTRRIVMVFERKVQRELDGNDQIARPIT
jgi:hypothetical protein